MLGTRPSGGQEGGTGVEAKVKKGLVGKFKASGALSLSFCSWKILI